jgi:hypothetical protein
VDVAPEDFEACRLVSFQQRRPGKSDENGVGQHRFHHPVQLATLGAMALVDKHKNVANGLGWLGFQIADERIEVVDIAPTEFVDERAEESRLGLSQLIH